eukprot:TRINITY_DN6038_c0_g1_i1.p1 TRINITY_DN6038_c0_g1~~TRINITY_DN6038_c0_g1_i1.p1  ORF type:complete len:364 (+),score=42.48 TRINITY_DN6038_c0_g1_i1:175-1266(+)
MQHMVAASQADVLAPGTGAMPVPVLHFPVAYAQGKGGIPQQQGGPPGGMQMFVQPVPTAVFMAPPQMGCSAASFPTGATPQLVSLQQLPFQPQQLQTVLVQQQQLMPIQMQAPAAAGPEEPPSPSFPPIPPADALVVAPSTAVAGIAGAIASRLRRQPILTVSAQSAEALNRAMKGLALAREFLKDEMRVLVTPTRMQGHSAAANTDDGFGVLCYVEAIPLDSVEEAPRGAETTVRVRADSVVQRTAHAAVRLAQRHMREQSDGAFVFVSMGTAAVSTAIRALVNARNLLQAEGAGLSFRPRFTQVVDEGATEGRPALLMHVVLHRRAHGEGAAGVAGASPTGWRNPGRGTPGRGSPSLVTSF